MDKDFGELADKLSLSHKGILLLRLEDAFIEERLSVVQNILPAFEKKLKNNFSVYQMVSL